MQKCCLMLPATRGISCWHRDKPRISGYSLISENLANQLSCNAVRQADEDADVQTRRELNNSFIAGTNKQIKAGRGQQNRIREPQEQTPQEEEHSWE